MAHVRRHRGIMNRKYLLDSLDGFKALVFRLLPAEIAKTIAYVPMTTDGPWLDADKAVFETAIGIPSKRTFWAPGNFVNVPPSNDRDARSKWVDAVVNISHRYLFLDPDIGFYTRHTGKPQKMVLVKELGVMLRHFKALIVYRHQYWPSPKLKDVPGHAYPLCLAWTSYVEKRRFCCICLPVSGCELFLYLRSSGCWCISSISHLNMI